MILKVKVALYNNRIIIQARNDAEYEEIKNRLTKYQKEYKINYFTKKPKWADSKVALYSKLYKSRRAIELGYGGLLLLKDLILEVSEYIDKRMLRINYFSVDEIKEMTSGEILPGVSLRDYQLKSLQLALYSHFGVIEAATGAGKTEIALSLIKVLQRVKSDLSTLIVVPTLYVAETILSRLRKYKFLEEKICLVSSLWNKKLNEELVEKKVSGSIFICHPKSIDKIKYRKHVDLLIYDECHHISAQTWQRVAEELEEIQYSIGFTATYPRMDSKDIESYYKAVLYLGKPLFSIEAKTLRDLGLLAPLYYLPFNPMIPSSLKDEEKDYHKIKDYLNSEERFKVIEEVVREIMTIYPKAKVLVLVDKKNNGDAILEAMKSDEVYCHYGSNKIYYYEEGERISANSIPDRRVIIATNHMDEGVDIENLDILILTNAGSSERRFTQRVGRVSRLSKSINCGVVIDIQDEVCKVLRNQSLRRSRLAKKLSLDIQAPAHGMISLVNTLRRLSEIE